MRHIAIYQRVSSLQQTTASQAADLERYAQAQQEPTTVYVDKASGKTMDRPGWKRLWAAVERGEVSKIVCWRLDRLGRTARGLTALFDDLQRHKVGLLSLKDSIDLDTPAGRLMSHVLASVAQYETEVRAERVIAGQAAARAKGKRWGGSSKGPRFVSPEQLKQIKTLRGQHEPIAAIARATGLSRPTVYSYL